MTEAVNHLRARFWKYVDRRGTDDCWLWVGSRTVRGGYGQLNDRGRVRRAHRLSYELHHGPVPAGLFVCHRCNNPACCNPAHLYAGTPKQNWDDTIAAGTRFVPNGAKGERHHDAKLTRAQARMVKESSLAGSVLARQLGVSKAAVSAIRRGRTWKSA